MFLLVDYLQFCHGFVTRFVTVDAAVMRLGCAMIAS